ncbi:MAG: aspartyl/asparaginyl beta-hydroxylase domain-containing protein [Gemmatimonadales bacterium]
MKLWFYDRMVTLGAAFVRSFERGIARASLIPTTPFLDKNQFAWTRVLEESTPVFRRELEALLPRRAELPNFQDISRDQRHLSQDDGWKTVFFYAYGLRAEGNCERCPETVRIVESIPGMKTAFFSILSPGKHIPLHRGPYRGVIRAHLGLIVPEPREKVRIQVGDEFANWEEGKVMVFDDCYPHQVWNDTDGVRVVLFLDIVRPLRSPMKQLNAFILKLIAWSPFIRDAETNYRRWEKEFDRPVEAPRSPAKVA